MDGKYNSFVLVPSPPPLLFSVLSTLKLKLFNMLDTRRRYRISPLVYVLEQFVEPRQIYSVVSSVSLGSNILHILWLVCLCSPEGLVKLKPVENQYKPRESLQGKIASVLGQTDGKNCGEKKLLCSIGSSLCAVTQFYFLLLVLKGAKKIPLT